MARAATESRASGTVLPRHDSRRTAAHVATPEIMKLGS